LRFQCKEFGEWGIRINWLACIAVGFLIPPLVLRVLPTARRLSTSPGSFRNTALVFAVATAASVPLLFGSLPAISFVARRRLLLLKAGPPAIPFRASLRLVCTVGPAGPP
jgi:hypothetical protein